MGNEKANRLLLRPSLFLGIVVAIAAGGYALFGTGSTASFAVSNDPTVPVLSVEANAPSSGNSLSMTLFGDGELEFHRKRWRQPEDKYWRLQLSPNEMDDLLHVAIDAGLAEWDEARIADSMRKATGGRVPRSVDGTTITVRLTLAEYRRGSVREQDLRKTIRYANPDRTAEAFPEIKELSALAALHSYLVNAQLRAEPVSR